MDILLHLKRSSTRFLALVVQRLDSAIYQWIVQLAFPILILWIVIYPVDSAIQPLNNRGQTNGDSGEGPISSSETQGQLVGAGKSQKVKKAKKSPWGQGFNRPVPNGRGNSGF